jgi:hypothetical protein
MKAEHLRALWLRISDPASRWAHAGERRDLRDELPRSARLATNHMAHKVLMIHHFDVNSTLGMVGSRRVFEQIKSSEDSERHCGCLAAFAGDLPTAPLELPPLLKRSEY